MSDAALAAIAVAHGTPLFVYDGDAIRARAAALRSALPARASFAYAAKANPSLAILALLRAAGAGAEIASRGELAAVLAAGFPPSRVLFAGPGKTDADLEAAARAGIRAIHAESADEIARLDAVGKRLGKPIAAGVRVHVAWGATESRSIIGGAGASKFGVPVEEALELASTWARLEGVRLQSLHVFNASNVRDAAALASGAEETLRLGAKLVARGLPIESVDVGGGLGVPYAPDETPLDVTALGRLLGEAMQRVERELGFAPELLMEPGRWLVAEAGEYVARVVTVKSCAGEMFAVLDGGINHLLRPALIGQPHPMRILGGTDRAQVTCRVVGPLCTSLDELGAASLASPRAGDLLAVGCAGAYGFTEAMPQFLSHAVPAEVLMLDGHAHVVRARREPECHLEGQSIPASLG